MTKLKAILNLIVMLILVLVSDVFAGEKVFFYHTDPAGTPLAMTDENNNVVWRADYRPFGEEQSITGAGENSRRFVGKEKDSESGLQYFGARYMKDEIGRFITVDPVGPVDPRTSKTNYSMLLNPQSLNRYAYGLNSPYKYVDPDGRIVQLIVPVLVAFGLIEFGEHAFPQTMGSSQRDSFIDQHGTDLMMMALPIENVGGRLVEKAVEGARLAKWGLPETLARHFKDHGADFGAKSAEEYASMASDFLARAQKGKLPTKISQEGTIRVYEPSTNTFGSYNPDGTTRTFYKPTQGQRYWERQPGKEPWTP